MLNTDDFKIQSFKIQRFYSVITVTEVQTKKQQKEFLDFPLELYKGNPYYTPPLYMDEKKIFRNDFVYNDM